MQAAQWVQRVADARQWSAPDRTAALVAVNQGSQAGASSAEGFFRALLGRWEDATPSPVPPGWDKLADVWASAGDTARTVSQGRDAGKVTTILAGTVEAAAGDVVASATALRKYGPWVLLALLAIAVGAWAWSR
jgi:uncharacterized membrane protein YeaQ/YmgE (transglycosylase-associated protein family)